MARRRRVALDLKNLEQELKQVQQANQGSNRRRAAFARNRVPVRPPGAFKSGSVNRLAQAPMDADDAGPRSQPFVGTVVRSWQAPVSVGRHLGEDEPISFWWDGQLVVVQEVLDRLRLAPGVAKYKVATEQGIYILARNKANWQVEDEVEA